jgi:hypothetical protein
MAVSINPMIPFPIPGFKRAAFAANLLHVLLAYTPFQHLPEQWRPRMKRGETVDVASSFSSVFSHVFGTLSLCLLQIFFSCLAAAACGLTGRVRGLTATCSKRRSSSPVSPYRACTSSRRARPLCRATTCKVRFFSRPVRNSDSYAR